MERKANTLVPRSYFLRTQRNRSRNNAREAEARVLLTTEGTEGPVTAQVILVFTGRDQETPCTAAEAADMKSAPRSNRRTH